MFGYDEIVSNFLNVVTFSSLFGECCVDVCGKTVILSTQPDYLMLIGSPGTKKNHSRCEIHPNIFIFQYTQWKWMAIIYNFE